LTFTEKVRQTTFLAQNHPGDHVSEERSQKEMYCHQCGTMQRLENFCRSRGYLTSPCRECRRKRERRWRAQHSSFKGLRGAGVAEYTGQSPEAPSDAPPGSPGKLAALEQRAALGFDLWHELDRRHEFEPAVEAEEDFNDELD
jgi:hypothetical protein